MTIECAANGYMAQGITMQGFEMREGDRVLFQSRVVTQNGELLIKEYCEPDELSETDDTEEERIYKDVHITVTHDFSGEDVLPGVYSFALFYCPNNDTRLLLSAWDNNRLIVKEGAENEAT